MKTKLPHLTLAAIALIAFTAKADNAGGVPTALFTNALNKATLNNVPPYPLPYASPSLSIQGEPPRVTVQFNNLYPAGRSTVIIYPGTPVASATPNGYQVIGQTTPPIAPIGGLWTTVPAVTFELAPFVNTSLTTTQTFTIAAVQTLPSAYVPSATLNPAVLNAVTFTIRSGFKVNGTIGTVK